MWHLLQISGPLDCEFGAALAERVPLIGWQPERVNWPTRRAAASAPSVCDSRLDVRRIPLLRGFARFPLSLVARTEATVCNHFLAATPKGDDAILLCTSPFFASVAERWPGPVVYWLTDLIARYGYARYERVARLDRRLCRVATLVCPNSDRISQYLQRESGCDPEKICLLPNATRADNLLSAPSSRPGPLPADLADLPRPIAGVIGNLASNMDWLFIEQLATARPHLSWALVGPAEMEIPEIAQREARQRVLRMPQVRSVGRKDYGDLVHYARSFDVAILPYRKVEPTYSGSSTRFYEHLAAGRPILATHGFEELLHKRPLLELAETVDEAKVILDAWETNGFDDGLAAQRWLASQQGTWQERASTMLLALSRRTSPEAQRTARTFQQQTA